MYQKVTHWFESSINSIKGFSFITLEFEES